MARIRRHRRDTVQSPLETYLREINEMALLTADEEKELAPARHPMGLFALCRNGRPHVPLPRTG